MANQYSITVSDESDRILKGLKEGGVKVSQAIDAAVRTLGPVALARLVAYQRQLNYLKEGEQE